MEQDLIKITELSRLMELSSRTLRYYEQVGLVESVRLPEGKYRYYTPKAVERLRQIRVLRKMQIPIKDIIHIYEEQSMGVMVETFVARVDAIDTEIATLSELRGIVHEFLQRMLQSGVSHISAFPFLYEEIAKRLENSDEQEADLYERLNAAHDRLTEPPDIRILQLPPMRVLTSLSQKTGVSEPEGFWHWWHGQDLPVAAAGEHALFEYQDSEGQTVLLHKIPGDMVYDGPYREMQLPGGLFAVTGVYADQEMQDIYLAMLRAFDDNPYYEVDYRHDGSLRQAVMTETVLSADAGREMADLFLPVKKRVPNAALYAPAISVEGIAEEEITAANPAVWTKQARMDRLKPILHPHYRVTDSGEAEYIAFVNKRRLSTGIAVKIPFRVDLEFRVDEESQAFAHGSDEGSIRFYHGNHMYGINMENHSDAALSRHAIAFHQPVFGDYISLPGRGEIEPGRYNRLSWIIGENHFAVILNGAVRYCAAHAPYMETDLRGAPLHTIVLGSNGSGKIYLRRVCVSQLRYTIRSNIKKGDFEMAVQQSNNIIPNIHPLVTLHYGENYWFNACAKYVMEALGEPEMDYWFFSGVTGDNLAQVYSHDRFRGDGATDYRLSDGDPQFILDIFETAGYASSFIPEKELCRNREMYVKTLTAYIDKGIPVIFNLWRGQPGFAHGFGWGVFVGYEDHGKTLLFLTDEKSEPERMSLYTLLPDVLESPYPTACGWVFVGEKKRQANLPAIYRKTVLDMPRLLTTENAGYCFGAKAFRAWAEDIESGRFDNISPQEYEEWVMHKIYVCNLATNGSCRHFLIRALEKNPDMTFLRDVIAQYEKLEKLGYNEEGADCLESVGGGFNTTLQALKDPQQRGRIVHIIRECASCCDNIMGIIEKNM